MTSTITGMNTNSAAKPTSRAPKSPAHAMLHNVEESLLKLDNPNLGDHQEKYLRTQIVEGLIIAHRTIEELRNEVACLPQHPVITMMDADNGALENDQKRTMLEKAQGCFSEVLNAVPQDLASQYRERLEAKKSASL